MQIEWHGNAVLTIRHGDSLLVTDPFISRNPGHRKLSDEDLRGLSAALVTHGHFDHVIDLPGFMERLKAVAYAPPKVAASLARKGTPDWLSVAQPHEAISIGSLRVTPYPARHVHFDFPLIWETLGNVFVRSTLPGRFSVLGAMLGDHMAHPMGECVAWLVEADGKRLLHFGSLALDPAEEYPEGVDLLSLPYQGNSKLHELVVKAVERLKPRRVYLQHFDDAFPPLSQDVPTDKAVALMRERFPEIPVIVPDYRSPLVV